MPMKVFHYAISQALGRSVWTHEFGTNWDGLLAELNGEEPPPTFEEILNLIPKDKVVMVVKP